MCTASPWDWFTFVHNVLSDLCCTQVYFFTLGLAHVCAMSSTVSNPVLYGWLNTNLRKEFIKVKREGGETEQKTLF